MAPNAASRAFLNGLAKPPPGCDENWTPQLPKRAGVGSAATAAWAALPAAFRPVASAASRPIMPSPFVSRRQAVAFARVTSHLTDQLATVKALQLEMKRSVDSPSKGARRLARRLGKLLRKGPSSYRALATALDLDPVPVTAEALAEADPGEVAAGLRSALKRIGASRALIAGVGGPIYAPAAGELVDPLAVLTDPSLDELGRAAAAALAFR